LEYMISQTENAISNIESFTEQLSRDLSILDGVNKPLSPNINMHILLTVLLIFLILLVGRI